jgi:ABC-2 type transport system ATP-binding protein
MKRSIAALAAVLLLLPAGSALAQTATHTAETQTVTSSADGTAIVITVLKPATASADAQVPVILQSHGWGGSRWTSVSQAQSWLDAGIGVVSIDQRGHGASGGEANVQDPDLEAEDIQSVISHIATFDWVRLDGPGDPVLGAIGGSYGGGYQTMAALDEIQETGSTRFNALAPEITWYDLPDSLAPQAVPRTLWTALLYAAGASMLPTYVHQANAWGTATGQWPDGTLYGQPAPGVPDLDSEFHQHSPVAFVERDVRITVPTLFRQGITDTLFNLNQGIHLFDEALTDEARAQSYLVGYNGGHVLPQAWPLGTGTAGDPCSPGGFNALTIEFFQRAFSGQSTDGLLPSDYNFSTPSGTSCLRFDGFDRTDIAVAGLAGGNTISTTGLGAPLHLKVADGPITVTGIPQLSGTVTALGLDSRAFFGLSVGTSATDARLVQNNVLPLRQPIPVVGSAFNIELPGVGVDVPAGQSLFLMITPTSDMFAATGSKPPGALVLSGLTLSLPQPGAAPEVTSLAVAVQGKGAKSSLVATLTDSAGAPVAGVPIEFSGDGASLGSAVTGANGVATLLLPGKYRGGHHDFGAGFAGNDDYAGSFASTST